MRDCYYLFKHMFFRYSFLSIIISLSITGYGQEIEFKSEMNYNIDMFPKTPDDAVLGKFIDIPSGNYTGVATFTIPLYTFNVDGIDFPIELNYSTSGIKVNEIASRVGLGWGLNIANTSLSQQTIGTHDLHSDLGKRPIIESLSFSPDGSPLYNDDTYIACMILGIFPFDLERPVDAQPDIFTYSLPTGNGNFILDSDKKKGIPIPYNSLKITPLPLGMQIIDEAGTEYYFVKDFGVKSENSCVTTVTKFYGDSDPVYKLKKITTAKNKEIEFVYNKKANSNYVTTITEQRLLEKTIIGLDDLKVSYIPTPPKCINSTQNKEEILTQINFPGGKIFFQYNDDLTNNLERLDLPNDVFLTKVFVEDLNGNNIEEFTLEYSYFNSTPYTITTGFYQGVDKRLRLDKVIDNKTESEYELKYYDDFPLPNRLSNSQDYWGVYNGQDNASTSLPTTIYESMNYPNRKRLFLGADKSPNVNYGRLGNLKKIIYPTGGYTEIFYEADDFHNVYDNSHLETREYVYKDLSIHSSQSTTQEFSIEDKSYELEIYFTGENDNGSGTTNIENCNLKIYKNGSSTPLLDYQQYGDFYKYDSFEIGDYVVEITPGVDINTHEEINCTAYINWYEEKVLDNPIAQKIGTIRVNKIHSNDGNGGELIREFTYLDPNSNYNTSSGKNHGEEKFVALSTKESPVGTDGGIIKEFFLNNNPGWQINSVRGKSVGYEYVQEVFISSENPLLNYKKEYKFNNDEDLDNENYDSYSPINVFWPLYGLERGLLLNEKSFDIHNQLVSEKKYTYNFDTYFNQESSAYVEGASIVGYGLEIQLKSIFEGYSFNFNYQLYPIKNYWIKEMVIDQIEYLSSGEIESKTTFDYSNGYKHTYPISQRTTNSLGEVLKTEYEYPQDLISNYEQSSMMQELVDRNIISTPIITKSFNDGTVTSERRTWYGDYHGNILPSSIYAKRGEMNPNIDLDDRKITYDLYDPKGNLMQYTLENGTPVSIIWGYNGQYPIAKIEGINYGVIQTLANNLINASNQGNLSESHFESLRNVNGAIVTGYIYKPLIGVTKIIHPNGQQEIYEYDAAGRLERIKDHEGKILKEVEYHYQNQP